MGTVVFPAYHGQLDPRQVLGPPSLDHHHVVLLEVVPLPGDVDHRLLPVGHAHAGTPPVGRVGLLGLADHRLEDDCLELRPAGGGPLALMRGPGLPLTVHLVEGGHRAGEQGGGPRGSQPGHWTERQRWPTA